VVQRLWSGDGLLVLQGGRGRKDGGMIDEFNPFDPASPKFEGDIHFAIMNEERCEDCGALP
jgi:hypothetical protein